MKCNKPILHILGGTLALLGLARYPNAGGETFWWRLLWGFMFLLGIDLWTRFTRDP